MMYRTCTVAIIGSGPAGCFTAQFLAKALPAAEITVFEALPVPYGLVRFGIAADHQGNKGVINQFERMFSQGRVRFLGNTRIGDAVLLQDIRRNFDVVVKATGLSEDKPFALLSGSRHVVGAGRLLRALNSYPFSRGERASLGPFGKHIAVIGNGNVAMDAARLLAKTAAELVGSDIHDPTFHSVGASRIGAIDVIGRSEIGRAKFDLSMLKELIALERVSVGMHGVADDDPCEAAQILRAAAARSSTNGLQLDFHFNTEPLLVDERADGASLRLIDKARQTSCERSYTKVVTAIGFEEDRTTACGDADGVYKVGWARRGPTGTVAENRKDARLVADQIIADLQAGAIQPGKPGHAVMEPLLAGRAVSFAQWQAIDRHEREAGTGERCRVKIDNIQHMLDVAAAVGAQPVPQVALA
ncbi:FAD-dependent oxidoreductase [Pseudorhodoferax sp. Leaf265]|uniref:FAD-dependent oxidoreductase n=1 Tax=Pseudorhodoferax sp. Leaf265 TaxID=1736315 RepID=UPI0006FF116B|nr:FAD-dependent oxidoreductase [Pseudorhodoferax sp. Leaf265]KQP18775.1 hypothetical protein ASF45_26505 [Pseudorhodoferax sp. Leaf265]